MLQYKKNKILFIMTGSIACYKACTVLSRLKQLDFDMKVVMTESALKFIGASTIEGLIGQAPLTDMYAAGRAMDHIQLGRWADIIVVAPATANFINKISCGLADDLASSLFLTHDFKKPFLIAPAMNTMMFLHPSTQDSMSRLTKMGVTLLESSRGALACGETGIGRLLEPEDLLKEITSHFSAQLKNVKINNFSYNVLITGGGTSEPIDDVRVITNKSTGTTASYIADSLAEAGCHVTYLKSTLAKQSLLSNETHLYETFEDLSHLLTNTLQKKQYHLIIHAAAVSDFSIQKSSGKISSQSENLQLNLIKNPKLIDSIKKISPSSKLVGFKLTSSQSEQLISEKVQALFSSSSCDYVVQNDWNDIKEKNYRFRIYHSKDSTYHIEKNGYADLANYFVQKILQEGNVL